MSRDSLDGPTRTTSTQRDHFIHFDTLREYVKACTDLHETLVPGGVYWRPGFSKHRPLQKIIVSAIRQFAGYQRVEDHSHAVDVRRWSQGLQKSSAGGPGDGNDEGTQFGRASCVVRVMVPNGDIENDEIVASPFSLTTQGIPLPMMVDRVSHLNEGNRLGSS